MARLLLALLLAAATWTARGAGALEADDMRAILVLNVIRLADWPADEPGAPFRVCTLGDDAGRFGQVLGGRPIKGGSIEVLTPVPSRVAGCRIVYVLREELLPEVVAHAARSPTLILAESPGALAGGAAMRVTIHADHVDFELNLRAVQQSGVILGSRLLRLAKNLH